jgi:RND family efflux transporter MFP subunit
LQLEQTQTQLEDSRVKTQLSLEQARDAYDFALRNRDIQLKLLQSAIDAAQVNYADAAKNSSKLSITAPIDGVVGEVLVDKGQDITIGTPLLTFVGVAENEVRISVNNSQRQSLTIGDPVQVTYGAINYTGSITSVGSVADGTLGYPVTISIPDDAVTVGGTVRVSIPIRTDLPLVPVSALRPRGTARAMASLRDGSQVVMQEVRIGQTRDTMIEIDINTIPDGYQIITTDLTNYDPTRQTIQLNNIASDLSNIMTGSILTGNTMTP